MPDVFWATIEAQCARLRVARTAEVVIAILNEDHTPSAGDAFFAGSGGDTQVHECLRAAGWTYTWWQAEYNWVMTAPDGSLLTYVEGDVYRGDVAVR